jgi:hypothetical protein
VLAGRHGTTEAKLRSLNPVLQQSEVYLTSERETLSSVAAEQSLTLSLLRQFNPELSSWPSTEPLPTGTTLLLPVYRSTTPPPGWNAASGAGFSSLHAAAGGGVDLSAGPALDACC